MTNPTPYVYYYGIGLLDDLHNYFPAVLYDSGRFLTVQDLLGYIQLQTQQRFNLFTNATRNFLRSQPILPRTSPMPRTTGALPIHVMASTPGTLTETFEFTFPQGTTTSDIGNDRDFLQALLGLMSMNQGQGQGQMEPVAVRPTNTQISNATTQRIAHIGDESDTCSICQDSYTLGQTMRTITRCSHTFHKDCVDMWFHSNVRCPVCRYDIRESAHLPSSTSVSDSTSR